MCSSDLRDTTKAQEAATSMKITAQDMARFGVIDSIVGEPTGGAHRDAARGEGVTMARGEVAVHRDHGDGHRCCRAESCKCARDYAFHDRCSLKAKTACKHAR